MAVLRQVGFNQAGRKASAGLMHTDALSKLIPRFLRMLRSLVFSLTVLVSTAALAETACPQHFSAGQAPVISNPKLRPRTQALCFRAFAVLHSGVTRTPLYAAEHLTRKNLKAASQLSRKDSFHAEDALPEGDRAELRDYERSGYDRGHMAPNADFATRTAQAESFSLANMVPQVHANNAGVWADIEGVARQLASTEGDLYVVTGPAFMGTNLKKVGNVLVPTHLWKVIYSPAQQRAGAYLVTNDEAGDYVVMSVSKLEKRVGINLLPGVPQKVRDAGMALPKPTSQQGGKKSPNKADEFTLQDFIKLLIDLYNQIKKIQGML